MPGKLPGWALGERDPLGAGPQMFEIVVAAGLVVEHVHDDVAEVEQNPAAFGVALDAQAAVVELLLAARPRSLR